MKGRKTVQEFLQMKPALVETSGKFYTAITSLEPLFAPSSDPLLKEVRRMAERKAFPDFPKVSPYRVPLAASWAWRNHP